MASFRRNHLAIALALFTVALILYVAGLRFEAGGVFILGCFVEMAAWIALLSDRSEGSVTHSRK